MKASFLKVNKFGDMKVICLVLPSVLNSIELQFRIYDLVLEKMVLSNIL